MFSKACKNVFFFLFYVMPIFVIQEHKASHLHWDFRFEYNGVLKSWALPKEPPTRSGIKRLAIQVDDHELSWADFEGIIPEGNYGAGEVKIWDKGNCEILSYEPQKKIELVLKGKKLFGKYLIVKLKNGRQNTFIFFKK